MRSLQRQATVRTLLPYILLYLIERRSSEMINQKSESPFDYGVKGQVLTIWQQPTLLKAMVFWSYDSLTGLQQLILEPWFLLESTLSIFYFIPYFPLLNSSLFVSVRGSEWDNIEIILLRWSGQDHIISRISTKKVRWT